MQWRAYDRAAIHHCNPPLTWTRFWREYGAAFDCIAEDPTVRVVVLSSANEKVFSAGIDRA
jgi:hypothetical protein